MSFFAELGAVKESVEPVLARNKKIAPAARRGMDATLADLKATVSTAVADARSALEDAQQENEQSSEDLGESGQVVERALVGTQRKIAASRETGGRALRRSQEHLGTQAQAVQALIDGGVEEVKEAIGEGIAKAKASGQAAAGKVETGAAGALRRAKAAVGKAEATMDSHRKTLEDRSTMLDGVVGATVSDYVFSNSKLEQVLF